MTTGSGSERFTYGPEYHGQTALYRLYDANDRLLYIGACKDPEKRWRGHAMDKYWWRDVERAQVTWYATRAEARAVEDEATRTEKPLYDRFHRQSRMSEEESKALADERRDRVIEAIKRDIQSDAFPAGTALPKSRDLWDRYDCSPTVLTAALWHLQGRDRLLARIGRRWAVMDPQVSVPGLYWENERLYALCQAAFGSEPFTITDAHERTKLPKDIIGKRLGNIRDAGLAEVVRRGRGGQLWWSLRAKPLPNPDLRPVSDFFDDLF